MEIKRFKEDVIILDSYLIKETDSETAYQFAKQLLEIRDKVFDVSEQKKEFTFVDIVNKKELIQDIWRIRKREFLSKDDINEKGNALLNTKRITELSKIVDENILQLRTECDISSEIQTNHINIPLSPDILKKISTLLFSDTMPVDIENYTGSVVLQKKS